MTSLCNINCVLSAVLGQFCENIQGSIIFKKKLCLLKSIISDQVKSIGSSIRFSTLNCVKN